MLILTLKKRSILKLLGTPARYIRSKIGSIYRKLVKKTDNNGVKQKNKSKWIDKLRFRIKNRRKSENSNTIDNNTIDNITFDNAIDNKISDKIRDIRLILSRLGNIITKKDKNKIKKELYELENKNNLSDKEKN